jgi:ATP-dependent phosphofructokinase / diphosphate-dependent phosphofructokinase
VQKIMKIGILTSGGDCPGLNSVLRAVVKTAVNKNIEVVGYKDGYVGLVYNRFQKLGNEDVSGIIDKGGTILGTNNSFNPFEVMVDKDGEKKVRDMTDRIKDTLAMHGIDGLIVVGGNNSLAIAAELSNRGIPIIVVPKTIENDVPETQMAFGFMTAIDTVTFAIDRLHSTAESHHRAMVIEVVGSRTGWVALHSGIAGGADIILIPEIPYNINAVARKVLQRKNAGKGFSIIVVSEGCSPAGNGTETKARSQDTGDTIRFGGVGTDIAMELEVLTQLEARVTVLGYLQRGGEPSPLDRLLTTRFGAAAVNLACEGRFGVMVNVDGTEVGGIPLLSVAGRVRHVPVDGELVRIAKGLSVSFGE